MKEFITAARVADDDAAGKEGTVDFDIVEMHGDQRVVIPCRAFKPNDGQLAVLMATTGRHSGTSEQIAGIINFFASVLDDDSHTYIVNRLLDRRDTFGIEQVQEIMEELIGEWTGRPTKSPSGSTPSRPAVGQNSTPTTPALT